MISYTFMYNTCRSGKRNLWGYACDYEDKEENDESLNLLYQ